MFEFDAGETHFGDVKMFEFDAGETHSGGDVKMFGFDAGETHSGAGKMAGRWVSPLSQRWEEFHLDRLGAAHPCHFVRTRQ